MPEFLPGRSYSYSDLLSPDILRANSVDPIDLIEVDMAELPIEEFRTVLTRAVSRPFGKHRLLWLRNAETANHIHQNTMLRILEEPPKTLIVILQARNISRFLPTVRSRLYTVGQDRVVEASAAALPDDSSQELEVFLRSFTDRTTLAKTIEQERLYQAEQFLVSPTKIGSQRLKLLEQTLQRLGLNGNLKIIIDSLLLHWPRVSGKQ